MKKSGKFIISNACAGEKAKNASRCYKMLPLASAPEILVDNLWIQLGKIGIQN